MISFLLMLLNTIAWGAACENMQIQVTPSSFNLASSAATQGSVVVKADTRGGGCSFFVTVDYGSGGSYSSRRMTQGSAQWPYQVSKDSANTQVLKVVGDASSNNEVLNGNLPGGSNDAQVSLNYWITLDTSNPWLRYGNYSDSATVRLYRGTLSSNTFVNSQGINMNYSAPKRADLSIVATGGSFDLKDTTQTLNYGTLTSGAVRGCDVILKTNAGYVLLASSQHNGSLKHALFGDTIPYTASFSGTTFNLSSSASSPVQIARVLGQSPASGVVIPFSATIGTYPLNQRGGSYSDQITLTVQSAE